MIITVLRRIKFIILNRKLHLHIERQVDLQSVKCGTHVFFAHHSQVSNTVIGDYTSIGRYSKIQHAEIGKFCSISWDVTIGAVSHRINAISTHAFSYRKLFSICDQDMFIEHKNCVIENDVWIGCGAIVMPGVRLKTGAIIGAGSVVTSDVDNYEIVAGAPARHIGYRFEKDKRNELLKSQWWNLSSDVIKNNISLFSAEVLTDEILEGIRRISIKENLYNESIGSDSGTCRI